MTAMVVTGTRFGFHRRHRRPEWGEFRHSCTKTVPLLFLTALLHLLSPRLQRDWHLVFRDAATPSKLD